MAYYWDRVTRLHEGPGERYEGRVSQTPITGMIHHHGCTVAEGRGLPRYQDADTMTAQLHADGVKHRGVMCCSECDVYGTVNRVKAGLRYLSGLTDLKPLGLRI